MKKINKILMLVAAFALLSVSLSGQGNVTGLVKDAGTNEELIGTTVVLSGTSTGTTTDEFGKFKLELPAGNQIIEVSYVGYETVTVKVTVENGKTKNIGVVRLEASTIGLAGVRIVADRARERETPVAFSTMNKKQIEEQLGSQDIPMVMNMTPSVYATPQGGGAGDARINVRGFNQRNVAIMINGVPVNDMENGWVYWSNWDGVGDATSSIQMQRGLSAVNLATPSVGGTMNVITNPAANDAGVMYKQEFGTGQFMKSTLFANSGLMKGKYAVSAGAVRKTGNGVIDGTWTDAWAYYFGASWNVNSKNRLELYAIGAPQRHGQNLYKQNIGAYSESYASSLSDYDQAAFDKFPQDNRGRLYNENWNSVSFRSDYTSRQWFNGKEHNRYSLHYLNERENYFHKPLVNLNWFTQWSDKLTQYTILYYSGGKGGGTGTYGSMKWDYSGPSRIVDWNATYDRNMETGESKGILRNSVNNQWTLGAISKLNWQINNQFKTSFGIDLRTAEIDHFREVRDLLGGDHYVYTGNEFSSNDKKVLGDKIAYHNTNTVDWLGAYAQGEYSSGAVTAFMMAGYSVIKYSYINHFKKAEDSQDKITTVSDWIAGYQIKGGASYRASETWMFFVNGGYVAKVPIFDNVIDDGDGTLSENPETEKFTSIEFGAAYHTFDDKVTVKGNFYYTMWQDRAFSRRVTNEDGSEGIIFINGMDQSHMGVEVEIAYQPVNFFRFDFAAGFGNWKYVNDVSGVYKDYDEGGEEDVEYNYYVKDLKVGDAPQTQFAGSFTFLPIPGLRAQAIVRYNMNHYAEWDPFSRQDETDREQSWKTPGYTVFDLHASYDIPTNSDMRLQVFGHVFNLFDAIYIQDAVDNSSYNAYRIDGDIVNPHQADASEVFLGIPRMFNVGIIVGI